MCGAGFYPPAGDYFCHFSEHRRHLWDPHDPASFLALKECLDDTYNNGGNLGEMQTILGLNRNEDGLLWDPYIANIVKIPHCMYWDPLHCEYASGGNVQYLLNAFALELISHGITMLDLDTFTQTCKGHSLGKKFWRKRVVHTRGKHIRAFASETLDALHVLALYCDAVVQHTSQMQDFMRAIFLARDISLILRDAGNIMLNVDKLEELQELYQELHTQLCGAKPKNHLTRHIVDCIRRWGVLFSCWSSERDHQRSKAIGNLNRNNTSLAKTILDRMNYCFYMDLQHDNNLLEECYLLKPQDLSDMFQQKFGPGAVVHASREMCTHIGHLRRSHFVHVMRDMFLQLEFFIDVQKPSCKRTFFCVGFPHNLARPKCWVKLDELCFVELERVIRKELVRIDPDTGHVQSGL